MPLLSLLSVLPISKASLFKLLGVLSSLVALGLLLHWAMEHYREQGRAEIQWLWDQDKAARAQMETNAVAQRLQENETLQRRIQEKTQGVIHVLEQKNQVEVAMYRATIADLQSRGGLRVPRTVCEGSASPTTTERTSADHATSSVRLPTQIEGDLLELAHQADQVALRLGACQSWIREQGFYPAEGEPVPQEPDEHERAALSAVKAQAEQVEQAAQVAQVAQVKQADQQNTALKQSLKTGE